jgi:hypothetical protein
MWFVRPEGWGIPQVRASAQGKSQGQAPISGVPHSNEAFHCTARHAGS